MRTRCWHAGLLALVGLLLCAGRADAAPAEEPTGWQFEVMPYAWLPGIFGTLEVQGRTAETQATLGDVLTLLWHGDAFTGGAYVGARYDRWSLFGDVYGGYLNVGASEIVPTRFCNVQVGATLRTHPVLTDIAVGYQLGEWRVPEWRRPISVGVYLGTRIGHLGVDLETKVGVPGGIQGGRDVSNRFDVVTPMLGVRWEIPVWDQVSFDFRGDLGGLPSGDRMNYNFIGDVRYWLDWAPSKGTQLWLEAGYRLYGFTYKFGNGNDLSLQFRGPLLAVGVAF